MYNAFQPVHFCSDQYCKGPGKRGHIVAGTLLPVMFLGLCKLGNICCGYKMFLNKIRNIFCVCKKCCTCGQMGKHLCRQQCVCNNVSSFAMALSNNLTLMTRCGLSIWVGNWQEVYLYFLCFSGTKSVLGSYARTTCSPRCSTFKARVNFVDCIIITQMHWKPQTSGSII